MNSKANLKAAREAIGSKNFAEAVKACNRVLLWESENYNAWVFLGVAYTGLENDEEAEKSYRRAIEINPDTMLAWQGLVSFYEKRQRYDDMAKIINDLLPRVAESGDGNKVVDYLNKLVAIYDGKDEEKYVATLKLFLPSSQYYDLIKDQKGMRRPIDIWTIIAEITASNQDKLVESRIQSRRLGVRGGPIELIRPEVEAEIFSKSQLGQMYENLLELAEQNDASAETKRDLELKLLNFYYKRIPGVADKTENYEKALRLAKSLAGANIEALLPYTVLIETSDAKYIDDYDQGLLDKIASQFPDCGLAKLIQGYRLYLVGEVEKAFDFLGDGMDLCPVSLFGYQCLAFIYHNSKEYETGLEYATKGRDLVLKRAKDIGILQQKILDCMELYMAHCYRYMDKKYYPYALDLYRKVIVREQNEITALEGIGAILREENQLDEAMEYFEKVCTLDPGRHNPLAEIGWIYCQKGNYEKAIAYITKAIDLVDEGVPEYFYRLGRIYWAMDGEYRENTDYAFKYFMQAVKLDHEYASGFTYLGHFYREIQKDNTRAKKLYQKAFMLDPLQVDAAFHLSDYYVSNNELAEAEAVFDQVTETSPKTGWAWRRLGFSKIGKTLYGEAIACFQKALRCNSNDIRCWEGLGESYSHEGRYMAALKAFGRATDLNPSSIHANHERALVQQKIGRLDEAIFGFKKTLKLAEQQSKPNYLPALMGLADTHLEKAKEEIQEGFFGRAADSCAEIIRLALIGLQQDNTIVGLWKLIGDACSTYQVIPSYVHLCAYSELQEVMQLLLDSAPNQKLGFPDNDQSAALAEDFAQLDVQEALLLPPNVALDVILACASFAYKQALVVCKNHRSIAPGLWHDIAILYHWMAESRSEMEQSTALNDMAIRCIRTALKMEPSQYSYWNTLGVISIRTSPKSSQYAFVKAMELNNRSAVPWTNYGFLCLSQQDYELANQAFDMAHVIDPEWISAWVGQAYVTSLWGNTDSGGIFQHAFESSNGTALDASYGYAETSFARISMSHADSKGILLLLSPAFALKKLTEQKLDNAQALNLLGLLLERLGHYERASEALAGAVLALKAASENGRIPDDVLKQRITIAQANLGRTLCASGDFEGAISNYEAALEYGTGSSRVYCLLGAGIACYFLDQLEESLGMFEAALNETEQDLDLRMDVTVLLSKVLWALGGDEQRAVAKNQMLASIADNPTYLPAIFSLCAMGILEGDQTLAKAALDELHKIPPNVAFESDKEQKIPWLISRFYQLQHDPVQSMQALVKGVHRLPWLGSLWSHLASNVLINRDISCASRMTSTALKIVATSKDASADAKAEAYENAARTKLSGSGGVATEAAKRLTQRALVMAPWRASAWRLMAVSASKLE
ncbi:hypothetical protein BX666DRAFT_2142351 [Dichotomocladium elegans]|nr:hypothetical protein BX666DRAFT_2142351 [Dichotomocladium elegans]